MSGKNFRALAVAAVLAASPAGADVCKVQLYLAGGTQDGTVVRNDPLAVNYTNQWSLFSYTAMSPNVDLVNLQIDLIWTSMAKKGRGNLWVGGLPPQYPVSPCPKGISCLYFANGSGNFGGFIEPTGVQISLDSNEVLGPLGLAYVTMSDQGTVQPANVQWQNGITGGKGRIRYLVSYFTHHTELASWIANQPASTLVCGF
ncbi:MAG: hypothetical protein ACREHE_16885 [Rhizomicrobium sp.]